MDSTELCVHHIWVIWVSQLTYKAPQAISVCNIVDKQFDAVHLLRRKEEVIFVNERSHFVMQFGCRVLRHDTNSVQKPAIRCFSSVNATAWEIFAAF